MERLVIGIGNTLRGDDGVGPAVADALAGGPARVIACHQLTPELADDLSRAERVLFVDASLASPPGELRLEAVRPGGLDPATFHSLDHAGLLALAEALYGRSPEALLLTVGVEDISDREGLSDLVGSQLAGAVALAREAIEV